MHVLSISSHVAYGHVGHGVTTFALQRLGIEVMAVPTVIYSNHPGYGACSGPTLTADQVGDVIDGLDAVGALASCDAVLTGYLPTPEIVAHAAAAIGKTRAGNPRALVCCDPVFGDTDAGFYLSESVAAAIRDRLLPVADIVTPNRFELEALSGAPVHSLDTALAAARGLGPRWVLVTSTAIGKGAATSMDMLLIGDGGAWTSSTPRVDFAVEPKGGGDLAAALFLAHMLERRDPVEALARATASLFAVFAATAEAGSQDLEIVTAQSAWVSPRRAFAPVKVR